MAQPHRPENQRLATLDGGRSAAGVQQPPAGQLEFVEVPFASLADYGPHALGVTYRFETPASGLPDGLTVRFEGRRKGVSELSDRDVFALERRVPPLPAGCGRVAVTLRALDLEPGEWDVQAAPRDEPVDQRGRHVPMLPRAIGTGRSGFAPVVRVRAPGVILGAWPALVLTGVVLGLVTQAVLARHLGLPVTSTTLLLALACLVGAVGAKSYFLVLHPERQAKGLPQTGLAVQGFVLGAVAAVGIGAGLIRIELPALLDTTGAGLMVGMAVGRLGCFFGGCCAGRPTASGWGRWSSDRNLGVRRIPTQILESAMSALVAAAAIAVLWASPNTPRGVVFVGSLAAYTAGRQLLFPLRDVPRTTATGRHWVLGLCALALALAIAFGVAGTLR